MKKALIFLLTLCLLVSFAACAGGGDESSAVSTGSSEASSESSEVSAESSDASSDASNESSDLSSEASDESSDASSGDDESSDESTDVEGFDVSELVGTWKRVSTEAEGDVNGGGSCTITIAGTCRDDLTISYKDNDFPETAFGNKPLAIVEDSGDWYAVVGYVGAYDTTYDLSIAEDGRLIFSSNFEIDGAPAGSIETFVRSNEGPEVELSIEVDYAPDDFLDGDEPYVMYDSGEGYSYVSVKISATVTEFSFFSVVATDTDTDDGGLEVSDILFYCDVITPDTMFVTDDMVFGDVYPMRGMSFVDENGNTRYYAFTESGFDGSMNAVKWDIAE